MMIKYHITKKAYISKVFQSLIIAFISFVIYMLIFFATGDEEIELREQPFIIELGILIVPLIILIIFLIYHWILMKKHVFYEEDNHFIIERGIFYKRKTKLPFENIVTIATKRSLLDMIVGISKIEIDTGTTAGMMPEGRLILNKDYSLLLKTYLENKKHNKDLELPNPHVEEKIVDEDTNIIYKASFRQLFLLGILREGYFSIIFSIIIVIGSIMQIGSIIENAGSNHLLGTLVAILIFVVVTTVLLGISHALIYYGYELKIKDNMLEYEYGFFSKTNFKVHINKINALYLKQSLGFKLFNYYSLDVSIIGIGDHIGNNENNQTKNESRYILPITKKEKLKEVLTLLNANELISSNYVKPEKFRKTNFIIIPLILLTIPLISLFIIFYDIAIKYYFVSISIISLYIIIILSLILKLKNHGFYINNNLNIKSGAYTIVRVLIKREKIQSITFRQGPIGQMLSTGYIDFQYKRLLGRVILKGYTKDVFITNKNDIFK